MSEDTHPPTLPASIDGRRQGRSEEIVAQALSFMVARLTGPLEVKQVAEQVGASIRHLSRCFQSSVGCGPARALLEIRMRRAASLLGDTNLPPKEIAARVGSPWMGSFGRAFRKVHGVSPVRYRLGDRDTDPPGKNRGGTFCEGLGRFGETCQARKPRTLDNNRFSGDRRLPGENLGLADSAER